VVIPPATSAPYPRPNGVSKSFFVIEITSGFEADDGLEFLCSGSHAMSISRALGRMVIRCGGQTIPAPVQPLLPQSGEAKSNHLVTQCPTTLSKISAMNSARYFVRREDDEPRRTPPDSPFRKFDVKCLKCGSYRLSVSSEFDGELGELGLILCCSRCRVSEVLRVG